MPDRVIDTDRIHEAVLALMLLPLHKGRHWESHWRARKSFDWGPGTRHAFFAHVGPPERDPDPHIARNGDRRRNARTAAVTSSAGVSAITRTVASLSSIRSPASRTPRWNALSQRRAPSYSGT